MDNKTQKEQIFNLLIHWGGLGRFKFYRGVFKSYQDEKEVVLFVWERESQRVNEIEAKKWMEEIEKKIRAITTSPEINASKMGQELINIGVDFLTQSHQYFGDLPKEVPNPKPIIYRQIYSY
ncbi:MAG: hypothetical protein HYS07_06180 [Chlamydiae bacterium]|nr:hypothetical protein [Chlamydiota bacterium]MBI3276276.1 hypothetical protein [Chlamydiota bacterium]